MICKHHTANTCVLDTDIVYKPITFRIDEYLIVRKLSECVFKIMSECG